MELHSNTVTTVKLNSTTMVQYYLHYPKTQSCYYFKHMINIIQALS